MDKLTVGLVPPEAPNAPFSTSKLQTYFALLQASSVKRISVWRMPIPQLWWDFMVLFNANSQAEADKLAITGK